MTMIKAKPKSDIAKIRAEFQRVSGGKDEKWYTVKEPSRGQPSKTIIRVLPPWGKAAEGFFYYTASLHYNFNIGGRKGTIACPESVGKGKCPVCEFVAALKNSDDPEQYEKLLKGFGTSIYPQRQFWCNIIDRDEPGKIRIFRTNKKFIEEMLEACDDEEIGDITDLLTGHDVTIIRTGVKQKTRYKYRVRTKSSSVKYKLSELYKLDKECVDWMDYENMLKYLLANYEDEIREVGFEIEGMDKPKKKIKIKLKSKKRRVDPDEEDVDDDDNEEEYDLDEIDNEEDE